MKIINFILGLGTAIILSALLLLGVKAFHPEPVAPEFNAYVKPAIFPPPAGCEKGDAKCLAEQKAYYDEQQKQQEEFQHIQKDYQDKLKIYNRDVFVILNIAGMLVFAGGFFLLFFAAIASRSIPIGVMLAGLWGIIYGYGRGWESVDDRLKFFVGLIVAVLVIGGSMWLMQRYNKIQDSNLKSQNF